MECSERHGDATLSSRLSPSFAWVLSLKDAQRAWKQGGYDGLEPSTPSLPCAPKPLPWVATGCRSAYLSRFRDSPICDRLPPVAPAWLHRCSMPVPPPEPARPLVLPG